MLNFIQTGMYLYLASLYEYSDSAKQHQICIW